MDSREVLTLLRADGWKLKAQVGSHMQLDHSIRKGKVTVPHPRKDTTFKDAKEYRTTVWVKIAEAKMTQRVYYGTVCEGSGNYGIVFLDFPGCISAGDTMEEVIAMGHEALQLHLDGMIEDEDNIPAPSVVTIERTKVEMDDINETIEDEEWIAVVPILVSVADELDTAPIPIETNLLREVSEFTSDRRQFIIDATRRELTRLKKSA